MAVVYFTSNAATGAGSLAEAVANAQPGDVIRPDETVFARGSTIEIVLASALTVDKDLTLDASPFRVRLDGGGTKRCVSVASGVSATFTAFDFVNGYYSTTGGCVFSQGALTLNRCGVYGGAAQYAGGVYVSATASINDCVITGCRATMFGGGLYTTAAVTLNGSTVIGNVAGEAPQNDARIDGGALARNSIIGKLYTVGDATATTENCVVDVASSQIGFVASPPDDLTLETWTTELWRSWDLRLLDDASDAPSPYRDSGDVGAMSRYDLQGNFRGRETNGVATCSPGAYETIQADLFWVGVDATGAEVVSPSFRAPDGWASSRFATASGSVAPQMSQTLFIDGNVSIADPVPPCYIIIGGGSLFDSTTKTQLALRSLHVGAGTNIEASVTTSQFSRVGAWARLGDFFATTETIDFDHNSSAVYIRFAGGVVSTTPQYGEIQLRPMGSLKVALSGTYECSTLVLIHQNSGDDFRILADSVVFRAKTVNLTMGRTTELFESETPVVFELRDSAKITVPDGAPASWTDEFEADVSAATSATLTLNGQTVYGDAPTCDVSLTGAAKVDERGLTSQALTLNADATLNVDDGRVCVESLTVADGASVAFSSAAANAATAEASPTTVATTNANNGSVGVCIDAVLTATESATVGAASFVGVGYFATPPNADLTAATFETYVRRVEYGANVASFSATATGPTTAKLEWSATDATKTVCVERQNAAASNGWETIAVAAPAESSPLTVALTGRETFRIFDGAMFRVDAAWFGVEFYQCRTVSVAAADGGAGVVWEASEGGIMFVDGKEPKVGENCCVYAKIKSPLSGTWVPAERVASVEATVWRTGSVVETTLGAVAYRPVPARTVVPGWNGVALPTSLVLEAPVLPVEPPVADETEGYNFIWTPDVGENPIFPESGTYRIQVVFTLDDGTQVYLTEDATVKNR